MTTESSSRGDPKRTLDLLWGTGERQSRGPKPGLSLDQIVRAAIEIADAEGLAALSMRRIANALEVTTMALYRYVPGKSELIDVMVDTVYGEAPLLDDVEGGWRAKLEVGAREDWALYHRHPWALQVPLSRPVLGPNALTGYESMLRAVSDIGLSEGEVVAVVHLVTNYVRGAARDSVDAARVEEQSGISNEQWWSEIEQFSDTIFDSTRYPTLSKVAEAGAYDAPMYDTEAEDRAGDGMSAEFKFGLQRLLDGIEAFIRQRSSQSNSCGGDA